MISLKQSIEACSEQLFRASIESYRATVGQMALAGARAYPPSEEEFKTSLRNLCSLLATEASVQEIETAGQKLDSELNAWGERAHRYYQEKTGEVKEVLVLVAEVAAQIGERGQRYSSQFGQVTEALEQTARLDDLTAIRQSLVKSVSTLRTQIDRMAQEGQDSVRALESQISAYQSRLEEAELLASQDPVTGLLNRREMMRQIEKRVAAERPFCILYLDLNKFKQINDTFGHQFGDQVLQQFSRELKSAVRSTDAIARWGGDEFIVLVDGDLAEAQTRAARIEQWVNGEYTLEADGKSVKAQVHASSGTAQWAPGESAARVLERADAAMYQDKMRRA